MGCTPARYGAVLWLAPRPVRTYNPLSARSRACEDLGGNAVLGGERGSDLGEGSLPFLLERNVL